MKKAFLLIITALTSGLGYGQISLTINDVAGPDEQITETYPPLTISLPPGGPGQTYNFMADSTGPQDTTYFVGAAATPYASAMTGANLATVSGGSYTYWEKSTAGFYLVGIVFPIPNIGVNLPFTEAPFKFQPKVPILTFPATVGMNLKSVSQARFEFDYDTTITLGGITANVTKVALIAQIADTSIIDGFGTGQFPAGEYPCLRNEQTQKITFKVEVFASILIFPPSWIEFPIDGLPEFSSTSYLFWTNGKKFPVATMNIDSLGNLTDASFQSELLRLPVGVGPQVTNHNFSFFPNPAQNQVSWDAATEVSRLEIFGADGKKIMEKNVEPGRNQVSVAELLDGLYWTELYSPAGHKTRKRLIISK